MRVCKNNKQIYGNWEVHHPDGNLMFRCEEKRAKWYLDRSLAVSIGENQIQLTFIPNGPGHANDTFYLGTKENACVVCKSTENLTRHHIVPHCFRKFFPEQYKSRNSHDITPLCTGCHDEYEYAGTQLKIKLAEEYSVTMNIADPHFERNRAGRHATALLEHRSRMPVERRNYLRTEICQYLNQTEVTDEELKRLTCRIRNKGNYSFGKKIVDQIDDLDAFIKRWRQHFLDTMHPPHLPEGWDIDKHFSNVRDGLRSTDL